MLSVSRPELVIAACQAGVIGAFPTASAKSSEELADWLDRIASGHAELENAPPYCPNLIMRNARMPDDLAMLLRRRVEMVIASVGSPAPVIAPLHDIGAVVFADVATVEHAEKAIAAGADGLILLTAGAGGQTGWLNGFAFTRAVRQFYDGPLVLAGGIADGDAMWAARALGCDLAYMGTKFIATEESGASDAYRSLLVESSADDVILTRHFSSLRTSVLRQSILTSGLDPDNLDDSISRSEANRAYGPTGTGPRRWTQILSAGHSVSGVKELLSVEAMVAQTEAEYRRAAARAATIQP